MSKTEINNSAIYTPQEISKLIGVGMNTVYNLIRSGQLRAVRAGHKYLILGANVRDFLTHVSED